MKTPNSGWQCWWQELWQISLTWSNGHDARPVFASIPSMRQGVSPVWYVIGDFLAVFVFTLVYDRVHSSFASGPLGGATFGVYAGLLVSFPTWIHAPDDR